MNADKYETSNFYDRQKAETSFQVIQKYNFRNMCLRFVILMTDTWHVKHCIIIIIIIIITNCTSKLIITTQQQETQLSKKICRHLYHHYKQKNVQKHLKCNNNEKVMNVKWNNTVHLIKMWQKWKSYKCWMKNNTLPE